MLWGGHYGKGPKISGDRVKVGPGTLYAMLSKFEKNQIIRLTGEENRRKSYIITEAGRKMLLEEYERLKIMAEDGRIFIEKMKNQKK